MKIVKSWGWLLIFVLGACLLATIGRPFLYAMFYDPAPDVPVTELLIDVSSFPMGWRTCGTFHIDDPHVLTDPSWAPRGIRESALADFGGSGGCGLNPAVQQVVCKFGNGDLAFSHLKTISHPEKPERPDLLAGWSYRPQAADHFSLECYEQFEYTHVPACLAVSVYGQYVTSVRAILDPPYGGLATAEDMRPILEAVDQRIAARLGR